VTVLISIVFVTAMVVANLSAAYFGPWASPVNSFFLVGISMVSRDYLHDAWHLRGNFITRMGSMIALAGIVAVIFNPSAGRIAIASATALVVSALAETVVFHRLRNRVWLLRSNGSNVPGALIDTIVFTSVAFGVSWEIVAVMLTQGTVKIVGGALWSVLFKHTINPDARRAAAAGAAS